MKRVFVLFVFICPWLCVYLQKRMWKCFARNYSTINSLCINGFSHSVSLLSPSVSLCSVSLSVLSLSFFVFLCLSVSLWQLYHLFSFVSFCRCLLLYFCWYPILCLVSVRRLDSLSLSCILFSVTVMRVNVIPNLYLFLSFLSMLCCVFQFKHLKLFNFFYFLFFFNDFRVLSISFM